MNVAIIPARGGSKRIPRKNIREFNGKPMIAWAIMTALESNLFDYVVVSTDDQEIASIALEYGAAVPFVRPDRLSNDVVETVPVIAHALEEMNKNAFFPKYACCIYPCTPFLMPSDLIDSLCLIESQDIDFVYPVVEYVHPALRAMTRTIEGKMEYLFPENELCRTQDLEVTYHDAGQFYWGSAEAWLSEKRMHTAGIGMVMPVWRFVDIDTDDDWKRAELFHQVIEKNNE